MDRLRASAEWMRSNWELFLALGIGVTAFASMDGAPVAATGHRLSVEQNTMAGYSTHEVVEESNQPSHRLYVACDIPPVDRAACDRARNGDLTPFNAND